MQPTEDEINRLEKAAWDAGVDQTLVALRDERDLAQAELRAVDMVLSGRSAFDAVEGRLNKILAAINAARVADPKAESVRAIALQARAEAAEAALAEKDETIRQQAERIAVLEPGARNYNPMRLRAEVAEARLAEVEANLAAATSLREQYQQQIAKAGQIRAEVEAERDTLRYETGRKEGIPMTPDLWDTVKLPRA